MHGLQPEKSISIAVVSLCELRYYLPLDVQRQCSDWIKLATTNFRIVWAKNPRNPCHVTPLSALKYSFNKNND